MCFIFIWDLDGKSTRIWDLGEIYIDIRFSEFKNFKFITDKKENIFLMNSEFSNSTYFWIQTNAISTKILSKYHILVHFKLKYHIKNKKKPNFEVRS